MRFTVGERIGFGLALLGMGAGGAAMIWPTTRSIGYGLIAFAMIGIIAMMVHHAWERGWFRSRQNRLAKQPNTQISSPNAAEFEAKTSEMRRQNEREREEREAVRLEFAREGDKAAGKFLVNLLGIKNPGAAINPPTETPPSPEPPA